MLGFSDLAAAIAVVINGLPQGLLALSFGFAALPTALGFGVGALGALIFGSVAPISFQAESIVLAGTMGKSRAERLTIVVITGFVMALVGALGLLQPAIAFIGPSIENGMMAGVGIILATVAINMMKANFLVGAVSVASAVLVYMVKKDLVWTIVISVAVGTIAHLLRGKTSGVQVDSSIEVIKKQPMVWKSPSVIRGALAMICLQIGGNIAYAGITGNIAQASVNVDHITLYSGLADAVSAFFGGGPVEAIISGTGAAPHPMMAGVLMMGIMAIILLTKLLPVIGKKVPSESIAGFLFVLGAIVVFPVNIGMAIQGDALVGGVTAVVTAATDPFIGLVAGVLIRFLAGL